MLIASTAGGGLRAYKYPLTGEFTELRCHAAPIAAVRAFFDDTLLFTCSEDGCVFVFDMVPGGGSAGVAARRELERLPFADEVLVTKVDLEERRARCGRLRLSTWRCQCAAVNDVRSALVRADRVFVTQVNLSMQAALLAET